MTMAPTLIDRDLLDEVLDCVEGGDVVREDNSFALNDTYSGRGMYGRQCVSITFATMQQLGLFMFELGEYQYWTNDDPDSCETQMKLQQMAHNLRVESMGTGIVAYFPGFRFAGPSSPVRELC